MKVDQDHSNEKTTRTRTSKGYLFRTGDSKEVSNHRLHLAETQRQTGVLESFAAEKIGRLQVYSL